MKDRVNSRQYQKVIGALRATGTRCHIRRGEAYLAQQVATAVTRCAKTQITHRVCKHGA